MAEVILSSGVFGLSTSPINTFALASDIDIPIVKKVVKYTKDNPPDFSNSTIFQASEILTTTGTWSAPENGWYRIICVGGAGKAGLKGLCAYDGNRYYSGSGGGGGGSGGISVSDLYIEEGTTYQVTINSISSSFSNLLTAGAGANGEDGIHAFNNGIFSDGNSGGKGGSGGVAAGGNLINIPGYTGGQGGDAYSFNIESTFKDPSGKASEDGNSGEEIPIPDSVNTANISGGTGGYCYYRNNPCIQKYHYLRNSSTNLVDPGSKRVVFGTSGGYQSLGIFPGCIIIEKPI